MNVLSENQLYDLQCALVALIAGALFLALLMRWLRRVQPGLQIGGVAGDQSLPIGTIVVTQFRPGSEWSPRRLTPGEGVLALLSHTVPAQTRPAQAMRFIRKAVDGAVAIESPRHESDTLAPVLLAELER